MNGSWTVARFYGIPLKLHWTFMLLVVGLSVFAYFQAAREATPRAGLAAAGATVALLAVLFASVLLHELGHSRQAAKYGIKTRHITLLPIGGVASLERIPEHPEQEAKVAIAGPIVNLLLAAVAVPLVLAFETPAHLFDPRHARLPEASLVTGFYWVNVFMFAFNLLPAFPMDGGRVLRATLARKLDYARATSIASDVGRAFSVVFVLVGLVWNILLLLVGIFVYLGASAEEKFVLVAALLRGEKVRDTMDRRFQAVDPGMGLGDVVRLTYAHRQSDFPVVEEGRLCGVLDRSDVLKAIQHGAGEKTVRELMRTGTPTLKPGDSLSTAFRMFQGSQLKMIPVVEQERLAGILTVEDVERAYLVAATREEGKEPQRVVAAAVPGFGRREPPEEESDKKGKKRDWGRTYI